MWRAMIVDDEPITRFGIRASVDWAGEGIELAADAANGAEALQTLELSSVDILITDIKMPVMDGLALTRRALELNPRMKVVLVSSHNDFEFVRAGLKLGVTDYILKHTLEPEELLQMIRRCKALLEKENEAKKSAVDHGDLIQLRRKYEGELKRYLLQASSDGRRPEGFPDWMEGGYAAVHIKLNRVYAIEEQHGYLYKSVLLEGLADTLYDELPEGIAVQPAENELLFFMPGLEAAEPSRQEWELQAWLERLKIRLEKEGALGVTLGYAFASGKQDIRKAIDESREASDRGFFEGSGVYRLQEGRVEAAREGRSLACIIELSGGADGERLQKTIDEWVDEWTKGGCAPLKLKEEASRVLSAMFKQHADPYALVECFDRLFKTETLKELGATLAASAAELDRARLDGYNERSSHGPADKALDYIRAHYLETMTLQQVADYVHVSKNYFSILFKKITGQNFIDYVISLRIQKAKELLAGTELKVYEVAEQSGFNDVKYFGKLFKKQCGLSPVEYRETRGSHGNAQGDSRGG